MRAISQQLSSGENPTPLATNNSRLFPFSNFVKRIAARFLFMFRFSLFCTLALATTAAWAQPRAEFKRTFAPTDNIVAAPENPLRQSLCLDGSWQFQPVAVPAEFQRDTGTPPELTRPRANSWEKVPLKIPSPWNVNTWGNGRHVGPGTSRPYVADSVWFPSYPASWDGVEMGWMRRSFVVPLSWKARRVVLRFEAVAGQAQVFINGQKVGEHFDSFLPFELDISRFIKRGQTNEVMVGVRKSDVFDRTSTGQPANLRRTHPNGSNMDNLVGIWNDVWLLGLPSVRTDDAQLQSDVANDTLRAQLTLRNDTNIAQRIRVGGRVRAWINDAGKSILDAPEPKWHLGQTALQFAQQTVLIGAGKTATVQLQTRPNGKLKQWSPNAPNLYGALFSLTDTSGTLVDTKYERLGWRQFTIHGRDLNLNGHKIQLFGDFLHPFGPFIGSRRYAWAQLRTIKDVGGNMVRPHAQPAPRFFLDLADEMGVCVLDEAAIFGSSISLNLKEPQTWTRLQNHVDDLVRRDRNHASVFGWSVANEMFAGLHQVAPDEAVRETKLLAALARRPRHLDPTREWVSIDGDEDLGGALPVWSRHFGIGLPDVPDINKPRMIGEHGGTYYASPPQLESLGGEQVFESVKGRNEALGVDLYRLITERAKPDLAVFSPSEMSWFGLEHLPFGFSSRDRVPSQNDGVWFGPFVENRPGVQIERLPPYAATLNPGFDPLLPLRRELPMFAAMKDALAGKNAARWAVKQAPELRTHAAPTIMVPKVAFEGDRSGALFRSLYDLGVPLVELKANETAQLLVIDGETLATAPAPGAINRAKEVLNRGGLVWLMIGGRGAALPSLRPLLESALEVKPRRATSLLHEASDARVDGFSLDDLYFADEKPVQLAGLSGPFVQNAKVLLRAPNTEWSLFERQPESAKQSSLILFERLDKGADAALVERAQNGGTLWISTLDASAGNDKKRAFWSQLWRNLGVLLAPPRVWLLAPGRDDGANAKWKFTLQMPAESWTAPDFDDAKWQVGRAPFGTEVPGGQPNTPWHSSDIWARREFSLDQLPPDLRLIVHHDEDVEVFLNNTKIWSEASHISAYKDIGLGKDALAALRVGRNVLAVHCHQTVGGQFLDVGIGTTAPAPMQAAPEHDLLLDGPPQ